MSRNRFNSLLQALHFSIGCQLMTILVQDVRLRQKTSTHVTKVNTIVRKDKLLSVYLGVPRSIKMFPRKIEDEKA